MPKYFTPDEATRLLPQLRELVPEAQERKRRVDELRNDLALLALKAAGAGRPAAGAAPAPDATPPSGAPPGGATPPMEAPAEPTQEAAPTEPPAPSAQTVDI